MPLQNSPLLFFLVMVIDWIPGLSQFKSLCQAIAGDEEGARRTQENFSRQCPGISQLRSAAELMTGNPEAAAETQGAFFRNIADTTDALPVVSQVKSLAQVTFGDEEAAKRTQENFSRRCPGISQLRSAAEAISGDEKAARETQLEFIRNLGIPDSKASRDKHKDAAFGGVKKDIYPYTSSVQRDAKAIKRDKKIKASRNKHGDASTSGKDIVMRNLEIPESKKKKFYHYTNEQGAKAIERDKRIKASRNKQGDAVFGEGVYFTSMDPRHSSKEIRRNNYDTSPSFYNREEFADKTDYVVEVRIPINAIDKVADKRDVYLYKGDVDLDDYEYRIFARAPVESITESSKEKCRLTFNSPPAKGKRADP